MSFRFDVNEITELNEIDLSINERITRGNTNGPRQSVQLQNNEPIQLIEFCKKEFRLNSQALDFLNSIQEDLIVVAVVGKARTGKSYLMNLLLDQVGKDNGVNETNFNS